MEPQGPIERLVRAIPQLLIIRGAKYYSDINGAIFLAEKAGQLTGREDLSIDEQIESMFSFSEQISPSSRPMEAFLRKGLRVLYLKHRILAHAEVRFENEANLLADEVVGLQEEAFPETLTIYDFKSELTAQTQTFWD